MMTHLFRVSKSSPDVRLCKLIGFNIDRSTRWGQWGEVNEVRTPRVQQLLSRREEIWRNSRQVRGTESVTVVTDPKFELLLYLEWKVSIISGLTTMLYYTYIYSTSQKFGHTFNFFETFFSLLLLFSTL